MSQDETKLELQNKKQKMASNQHVLVVLTSANLDDVLFSVSYWMLPPEKATNDNMSKDEKDMQDEIYANKKLLPWTFPEHSFYGSFAKWETWNGLQTCVFDSNEFADDTESLEFFLHVHCNGKLLKEPPQSHEISFRICSIYNQITN